MVKSVKVLSKRKTIKTKESIIRHVEYPKTRALKSKKISDSKLDSSLEISGAKITLKGETSKISEINIIKGKSHAEISFSPSASNNSLKKKRIVDSIASMNASLKAKSQLRTVDGKFARDPLKISKSIQKSEDSNQPSAGAQITKIHRKVSSASNRSLRSKLKTVQNVRKDTADTSKKNSRLSTDIKISTLELETQSPDKKESSENLQNDLPSPSPHGSSYQPKVLRTSSRNSSLGRKYEGKETNQNKMDDESIEETVEIDDKSKSEEGNGKRLKKVAKKVKEVKEVKEIKKVEESTEQSSTVRGRPRKSLPAKISETKDVSINLRRYSSSSITKNKEDDSENTESETVFVKKDEVATKGLETRGNKKSKQQLEDVNQTSKVSLEAKQYSELKEDMLKNVALKPSKISKRTIKTQKSKVLDSTAESVTKKEKTNTMRTSPRNAEKKNFSLDNKESEDDVLRKSTTVFLNANENFELKLNEVDNKLETQEQSAGEEFSESINETKIFEDTASNFVSKTTTKRKKRSKSDSRVIEKVIQKSLEEKEISTEIKTSEIIEEMEVSKISESPDLVNLSIEHIQQESCNSNMDSGKENSSEMSMSVAKLKVTRPKKTRNSRKERISKRTLNNVIGILTEGVNIPIEAQESVVLTLQTSVEISNPDNACQNNEPSRLENNSTSSEFSGTERNFDLNVIENTSERSEIEEPKESDHKTGQSNEILKVDENKSNDPPTNDIILDLSRRKPKGKGSFLEKIVSKIAKKKDVLLEGDTSFSSETSNDNHNILINVGSISSDSSMENVEKSFNNQKSKVDYAVSEGEDTSSSKIEANELQNQNDSINSNLNNSENVDKNKKISTRNSKKRSLDVNSPEKNKRKIATEAPEETEEEKELCFSDIMSLVHKSEVSEEDIINEQIIFKEKAQTETEKEETVNEHEIAVEYQVSTKKKTKSEAINAETPRNSKRKFKNENIQDEEVNNSLQNIPNNSDESQVDNQKGMRKSTRKSLRQDNNDKVEKVTSDEKDTQNNISKSKELPEDSSIFEPSKLLLNIDKLLLSIEETNDNLENADGKSKNLAEEHLDLSDDDPLSKPLSDNVYHFSEESDDSGSAECFKRLKNRSTKGTDKDSNSEMFKVPNAFSTNKRSSKVKSLVHENFDSTDDLSSEDTSASESTGLTSEESGDKSAKRRYSKRKQVIITPSESEDDVSTDSFLTVPKATFNEENIIEKRQTPGRKTKRNISLVDEHIILPGDESLEQENQSLEEESFDITMVSSTEKKRPGRKSKKNVSSVNEDIPSEDTAGTDSEAEINFEKAVEDKLCEGIQTQLERSELVFVSNMEKIHSARKSNNKNAFMDEEDIVEENEEKQSTKDTTSAESLTEIEATQSVLGEKKRRGRKPKRNIVLVDNVTNDISVRGEMQLEEEISVDSLAKSNSEIKYNLEVQVQKGQNFLDVQNNLIRKKRRGRKPKMNILVDEVSSLTHTKEGLTEENMSELINSLEEPKNLDTEQNKSPEKKRPGRKPKKHLDEEYLALLDNTVQNDSLLESYSNQETQDLETTKEVEMQPKNIEVEVNENKLLYKKRGRRKSRKKISSNEFVFGETNSNVSSQGSIESEMEEKVLDKLEEIQTEKSVGILVDQTSFEKKRPGRKPKKSISEESLIPINDTSNLKEIVPEIIVAEVSKKVEEEPKDVDLPAKKKPGRKSKKNNSLVDEHLSLPDDIVEEINGVTKSLEIIESNGETNISEINVLERKRPGRKPKKVISEQDNSAEEKTLIKNSEEELNNSLMEELENKSPEEPQARKLEIEIQSSPLGRKRPGRKSKKNISLVDDVIKDDFVQEKQEKEDLVINNCSQIEEIKVSQESEIGSKLETSIQNLVVEKKRPGRKPKKDVLLIDEHLVLPNGNNTRNKESSEVIEDRSQRATSDINTVQNESVERKPRGRKTKKYISLCEEHLALPDAEIPVQAEDSATVEKIVEDGEKGKTINADTITKANETSEILIRNTYLERKRPGRKAKKNISLVDEHLDLLDDFDIHKINLDSTKDISVNLVKDKKSEELKASEADAARISSSERKRKSTKRKAKNASLLDEHLALSDENSSETKEDSRQENVSTILEKKNDNEKEKANNTIFEDISSTLEKIASIIETEINREEILLNERLDDKSTEDGTLEVEEQHSSTEDSQNFEEPSDQKENVETALELVSNQEPSESKESLTDDFQTPKKRPVGNFAVVHTKSGEILIVEKKKKLTKEAAKFFCDICATSFTRKSSLKKHNLSQSHLLQIYHTPGKEQEKEIATENEENILTNNEEVEKIEENLIISKNLEKKEKVVSENCAESLDVLNELLDQHFEKSGSVLLEKTPIPVSTPTSTEKPLPAESQPVENIDDELLDEEICKITENMTHDEYVLTDHISPIFPENASTPIKNLETKAEVSEKGTSKKKNKKKNLANEHLDLDTPEPNLDSSIKSQNSLDDDLIDKNTTVITNSSDIEETILKPLLEDSNELNIQKPEEQIEVEEAKISNEINVSEKRKTRKQTAREEKSLEANTDFDNSTKRVSLRSGRNQEKKEETSRPKRNQHKQNYKEYECFDFDQGELDLNIPTNKQETSKSRKVTSSSRESSRSKKKQEKEKESGENKEPEGPQNIIEKRSRHKSRKGYENSDSLTQILGTENENNSTSVKLSDGERIQDALLPTFIDDCPKSISKIEDSLTATFDKDDGLKLDFLNVAETLKAQTSQVKFNANESVVTEFDSDDNSLNTDMSVDIQKLLDDPELSIDNNSTQTNSQAAFNNDNILSNVNESGLIENDILSSIDTSAIETSPLNEIINGEVDDIENIDKMEDEIVNIEPEVSETTQSVENINKTDTQDLKTNVENQKSKFIKGQKARSKQKKGSSKCKITDLNDIESDNEDTSETQNKSQIVRSVFGRVFGGEKVDKVKEVLDDWNSKSESSDNEFNKYKEADSSRTSRGSSKQKKDQKKGLKRRSRNSSTSRSTSRGVSQKRKSGFDSQEDQDSLPITKSNTSRNSSQNRQDGSQLKTSRVESSLGTSELLITSLRCRESKKRAEERISTISRAFDDESPIPDDVRLDKSQKASKTKGFSYEFRNQVKNISESVSQDSGEHLESTNRGACSKKSKKKNEKEDIDDFNQCSENELKLNEPLNYNLDQESISSVEPSLKSQSPVSQLSQNSEEDDDEIEDDLLRRRMSPFFVCNNSYTSLGSSTNSENEASEDEIIDKEKADQKKQLRRKSCSSEFSGEKIVIRSPLACHEDRPEIVTIAPTDAIEDNALDVPQEIVSATSMTSAVHHKSRQGKVLNFDQELFVECCSRLKATTEKELRGAKKIKLDHSESYRKDDPSQLFRPSKDRWRDVESQNSLGSLLESVNQVS